MGWILLLVSAGTLLFCSKQFAKDLLLVHISLAILGTTEITTDIGYRHMFEMGAALFLAVVIPYVVSRYIYKDYLVRFQFHHGRQWFRSEIIFIGMTAIISFFLLPFYLKSTGAYMNWSVEPGVTYISRLFVGTNALGIWDEFFFVSTVACFASTYTSFCG